MGGYVVLHALAEFIFQLEGTRDILLAEHLATKLEASIENILLGDLAHLTDSSLQMIMVFPGHGTTRGVQ
jgi:hypothetical protein